jgi:hypothetical protein
MAGTLYFTTPVVLLKILHAYFMMDFVVAFSEGDYQVRIIV